MSDYFPTVRRGLGDAVARCAHLPWYRRMVRTRRLRVMAVAIAALVVATPAVGAVTNWFGIGAPNHFPAQSATRSAGRALPGTSELLGLRIPDPQGGPAWGLRLVHTTREDTCIQLGRVEDSKLGSLGIDDAWGNDHLFHPFPNTSEGEACGVTDAVGNGFVNVAQTGVVANANPDVGHGAQARSCRALSREVGNLPVCPAGSTRIVFMGLLGPDAAAITYEAPDHHLKTERTNGPQGAYLLVFPRNQNTCTLYTTSPTASYGPCGGTISFDGASPGSIGAIKAVTYKNGHSCTLAPSSTLQAAFTAFRRQTMAELGKPVIKGGRLSPRWLAAYRRLFARFLTREHLTETQFRDQLGPDPQCPPVGAVSPKGPRVTRSEIVAPVLIRRFPAAKYSCPNHLHPPQGCDGLSPGSGDVTVPIEWSFKARKAVTSSRSWYEWSVTTPTTHGCVGGGSSFATYSNIRAGTTLHYSQFFPVTCHGSYKIVVGFEPEAPAGASSNQGGDPGQDGSIIVGQTSFKIP
jgi:hypothetical protein